MVVAGAMVSSPVAGAAPDAAHDQRLVAAAHEFEACLMKELLEPLQNDGLFRDEKEGESADSEDSKSSMIGYGAEALARAISDRGGFGIAADIIGKFSDQKVAGGPMCGESLGVS